MLFFKTEKNQSKVKHVTSYLLCSECYQNLLRRNWFCLDWQTGTI